MGRLLCLLLAILLAMLFLVSPSTAALEQFSLDESVDLFYTPQVFRLANGLQVVLKPRPEVQKVSIRMAVRLGMDHFECDQAEMPHVIEHMLFEGTGTYTRIELEQRVADHGASWNASTAELQTVYEFEVYGPYLEFALDTLFEIFNNSTMDEEAMHRAIEAAGIESDNSTDVKRFWQSLDFGGSGSDRLFSDMGMYCPPVDPYSFTHGELLQTWQRYYRPGNTSLILVGNFDVQRLRQLLADSFGRIPASETIAAPGKFHWQVPVEARYESSTLLELRDTSDVGIVWTSGGYRGAEYTSLKLLKNYLNTRLYTRLRNELQLSYGAVADGYMLENQGFFYLEADTRRGNEEQVLQLLRSELDQLLESGMGEQAFEQLKRAALIGSAMEDLDNYSTADYYAGSLFELADGHGFWNYERKLMALDYETFIDTLRRFFRQQRGAEYINRAAFSSPTLIGLGVVLIGLLVLLLLWRFRRRANRSHSATGP